MKKTKNNILKIIRNNKVQKGIFLFLVILIFSPKFLIINDPDYYWHYRAGKEIVSNKSIPITDPYSFSFPNFKWVNHEWLSDTLLYQIEDKFTPVGLSLFYLTLFGLLVLVLLDGRDFSIVEGFTLLLFIIPLSEYIGVREQIYSFLFFAIFLSLLKKGGYFLLPVLFLLWANIHGGFAVGIFFLGIYIAVDCYKRLKAKQKIFDLKLVIATSLSLVATLINPYSIRVYEEVIRTVGDNYLTRHIVEWLPITAVFNIQFAIYLAFFIALAWGFKKKIPLEFLIIFLILLVLSFKSIKYIPFFIIATLPFVLELVKEMKEFIIAHKNESIVLLKTPFTIGLIGITVLYFNPQLFREGDSEFYYPSEATNVLNELSPKNIFNAYNWGGFLIRYAPNHKYLIDGRMPSWRTSDSYPFKDYSEVMSCDNIDTNLAKYKIDLFMIRNQANSKTCDLRNELKNRGWQEKYSDSVAIIFEK